MSKLRTYGKPPFKVVTLHGGPGAAGEMAPVAKELTRTRGVLEPFQTASSIDGQIEELKSVLDEKGDIPVTVIGYSWGAWLGFLFAAWYPERIKKLILVSSGPFEDKYAARIMETRIGRLCQREKNEIRTLQDNLKELSSFERFGEIMAQADDYDPLPVSDEVVRLSPEIHQKIWNEAAELRKSGKLLEAGKRIQCPVLAIHGDHDPHPAEGVRKPLLETLKDFRFILLGKCGHKPWIEKQARDEFFKILYGEML
jgi:pimeloyl-ACP methyl ester carboxylesterase